MTAQANVQDALRAVLAGETLPREQIQGLFIEVLGGSVEPALLGGLLVALSQRGETAEEIAGVSGALRSHMRPFVHDEVGAIDTCGTGGDGLGTFNLSTASAFVAAAAGARVVKHGGRSVSSRSGSADLLEALGGRIDIDDDRIREGLAETGFAFLFAPRYHPAMRFAAPVRGALGVRTVFNLVGPLANPGGVRRQLLGTPTAELQGRIADALEALGVEAAYVVHGAGGADELTLAGRNSVRALGAATAHGFDAEHVGLEPVPVGALAGGDAAENAALFRRVLDGGTGPLRAAVLLNASAALVLANVASDPIEGVDRAAEAIDSGRARSVVERWAAITSAGRREGVA